MRSKFRTLITYTLCVSFLLFQVPGARSESEGPLTGQIRTTVEKVLGILENSTPNNPSTSAKSDLEKKQMQQAEMAYRSQLRKAIFPQFDFPEMAKRSLGLNWRPRTPGEQEEFVEIFTGLLEDFFSDNLKSFKDEKFVYMDESQKGKYAKVDTMIVTKEGEEISLKYMLHQVDEDWKVYDMVIENVSLVKTYRSQFNRIIANAYYQELARRINKVGEK